MFAKPCFFVPAALLCLSLVVITGCSTTPQQQRIDKAKFEAVYRAGHAVQDALTAPSLSGSPHQMRMLIGAFTTEASIAKERASTETETGLANAYGVIAARYKFYWELQQAERRVSLGTSSRSEFAKLADMLTRTNRVLQGTSHEDPASIIGE